MTAAVILGTFLASVFLYRSTEWDGLAPPERFELPAVPVETDRSVH